MKDYALQHQGGVVMPIVNKPYDEGLWNLYWASIPELDKFLDLPRDDFDGFRALAQGFPYIMAGRARRLMSLAPDIAGAFANEEPRIAALTLKACVAGVATVYGSEYSSWLDVVQSRLHMAQSLIDVRDAVEVCRNVVAVDFRARRRT
jgi:hypothetical protein